MSSHSVRSLNVGQPHRSQCRDVRFMNSDKCKPIVFSQPCRLCFNVNTYFYYLVFETNDNSEAALNC